MEDGLKYWTTEGRMNSYKNFPAIKGAPLCTPKHLADAGFYSIRTRKEPDSVKCFACEKQLSNWEAGDDPWQEHIRREPECPYVVFKSTSPPRYEDFMKLSLSLHRRQLRAAFEESKVIIEEAAAPLLGRAFAA